LIYVEIVQQNINTGTILVLLLVAVVAIIAIIYFGV